MREKEPRPAIGKTDDCPNCPDCTSLSPSHNSTSAIDTKCCARPPPWLLLAPQKPSLAHAACRRTCMLKYGCAPHTARHLDVMQVVLSMHSLLASIGPDEAWQTS